MIFLLIVAALWVASFQFTSRMILRDWEASDCECHGVVQGGTDT